MVPCEKIFCPFVYFILLCTCITIRWTLARSSRLFTLICLSWEMHRRTVERQRECRLCLARCSANCVPMRSTALLRHFTISSLPWQLRNNDQEDCQVLLLLLLLLPLIHSLSHGHLDNCLQCHLHESYLFFLLERRPLFFPHSLTRRRRRGERQLCIKVHERSVSFVHSDHKDMRVTVYTRSEWCCARYITLMCTQCT